MVTSLWGVEEEEKFKCETERMSRKEEEERIEPVNQGMVGKCEGGEEE